MTTLAKLRERWRWRKRFLLPHNYASIPQPWWYNTLRYLRARYIDQPAVTHFPELNDGAQYCCSHCDRTFPDHYTRNFHEWETHPGCPKYRKATFWRWMQDDDGWKHSCRCKPEDCERGCFDKGSIYRRPG